MLRPYLLLQQKRESVPARTNMRTCWQARDPPEREDGSVSRKCSSRVSSHCPLGDHQRQTERSPEGTLSSVDVSDEQKKG